MKYFFMCAIFFFLRHNINAKDVYHKIETISGMVYCRTVLYPKSGALTLERCYGEQSKTFNMYGVRDVKVYSETLSLQEVEQLVRGNKSKSKTFKTCKVLREKKYGFLHMTDCRFVSEDMIEGTTQSGERLLVHKTRVILPDEDYSYLQKPYTKCEQ